ncbi:amidohydrolase family protein [Aquabacterium sp. J223]|uniref:amidohydrolase family protein n=1 Tax=Aquabacterium sp. J223 TaxID=2898431 RepID=UPI0021ADBC37|nr:amidohydrolase family protein [Aquabacterium sp. J223]UUX95478.1 amidohydrolase [Aquabacterium sp. J223]
MKIDVHFHAVPPAFKAAALRAGRGATIASGFPDWSVPGALAVMDRHGIATAITSISQPGVHFGDDAAARALARRCNEEAAEAIAQHPARFGAFATLPLPDVDGACAEVAHALDVLKLDGVCLLASYGERFLGDPSFDPVLRELDARAAVVFVHPNFHPSSRALDTPLPAFLTEFPFDTTRGVTRLIFSGATRRFARIRFILAHAGGTLPYLAWRLSLAPAIDARFAAETGAGILEEIGRFWFDTAQAAGPAVLAALRQVAPADRVLFGSDWPYCPETVLQMTGEAVQAAAASDPAATGIARRHALALFPRLRTQDDR